MSKTVWKAPRYVKASDPDALTREMVRNNIRARVEFKYFDIGMQADGEWYAWYLADVSDLMQIRIGEV